MRGTERSPAEKHDITCAGRGWGDCIRAIGCAEERRGNTSIFIDQKTASVFCKLHCAHTQFINDNNREHKSQPIGDGW